MDPISWVVVGIIVAAGAGFGAGWGLKPDQTQKALEAQAQTLEALADGQREIVEAASAPMVIDAELRATLAEVPVQCIVDDGGDPFSPACAWATCLQFGQSNSQRPECREIEAAMLEALRVSCPDETSDDESSE